MSSKPNHADANTVCLYCGAPQPAADRGPFAPDLGKLGEFAPRFVAQLKQQGWIEPTHQGGFEPSQARRAAQRLGVEEPARVLCGHRYEIAYFDRLRHLEDQLGERPQASDPLDRHELFALAIPFSNYRREDGRRWRASRKVAAEAIYELALLRKRIPDIADLSALDHDMLNYCSGILCEQPDPWLLVRSLVQLLRAAPVPTLTPTLKYWHDAHISSWTSTNESTQEDQDLALDAEAENKRYQSQLAEWAAGKGDLPRFEYKGAQPLPPAGWSKIPSELAYSLHNIVADAQSSDQDLYHLRTKFSRYLLDRLKPSEPTYERDHFWRIGCLLAAEALQINPDNKGHRTVYVVAEKDPHDAVRKTALAVYPRIRRGGTMHASPRRVVLNAIWELFRAHMLALGVVVDETGAAQTKREMIRRTTRPSKEDNT
jgi:hypothetical protein